MKQKAFSKRLSVGLLLLLLPTLFFAQSPSGTHSETTQVLKKDLQKLKELQVSYEKKTVLLKSQAESLKSNYSELSLTLNNLELKLTNSEEHRKELETRLMTSEALTNSLTKSYQDIAQEAQKIERQNKILKTSLYITGGVAITFGVVAGILLLVR